jgi:hypothetical protein
MKVSIYMTKLSLIAIIRDTIKKNPIGDGHFKIKKNSTTA